jgi:hypothetical protein
MVANHEEQSLPPYLTVTKPRAKRAVPPSGVLVPPSGALLPPSRKRGHLKANNSNNPNNPHNSNNPEAIESESPDVDLTSRSSAR